eukprot:g433.t1
MNTRSGSHHQYLDSLHDWAVALPAWKNLAARLPRYVGTMGYDLAQGWFLRRSVQEEALTSAGLALDSFRGYNRSWFSPWNYFDRISDINASRLFPCNYSDHRFDRGDLRMEMNSGEVGKLVSFDLHQLVTRLRGSSLQVHGLTRPTEELVL